MDVRRADIMAAARAHASETSAKIIAFNGYLQHVGSHMREARARAEGPHARNGEGLALARAADDLRLQEEEMLVAEEQLEAQHQAVLAERAALEEALGYYHDLFQNGIDAVALSSSSGVVREGNRALATALNVDPRFIAGKPIIAFVTRKSCGAFRELLVRARNSAHGTVTTSELEFRPRRKGDPFRAEVRVRTSVSRSAGDAGGSIELRWTLGPRQQAGAGAEALALNRAKGVLAVVAHDLRNPLHVFELAISALAPRLDLDPRATALTDSMRRALQRMHHLVDDVLASTTLESGGLAMNLAPTPLGEVVREAVAFVEPLAQKRGVHLALELPSHELTLMLDRRRVEQLLVNLTDNALKFAPRGTEVAITVHTQRDRVRVEVRDQGPGLAPENTGHVFDLFWQAEPGKGKGVGLGLAIAKHIVERHGGAIGVESSAGTGAAFWFDFPYAPTADALDGAAAGEGIGEDARASSVYPIFAAPKG